MIPNVILFRLEKGRLIQDRPSSRRRAPCRSTLYDLPDQPARVDRFGNAVTRN